MKKLNIVPSLFMITLAVFLFSCGGNKKAAENTKEENIPEDVLELRADQIKMSDVELGSIEMHPLSGTLKANGIVASAPQNLAMVCMPMGGFIKHTSLMPGNYVHRGQTLATVENSDFIDIEQNYLEAKSKLAYTSADYNRQKYLYKSDIASQKNMQLVTSEYKTLKIQIQALGEKLRLIGINPSTLNKNNIRRSVTLVSPISGYVKTVNVSIGKSVSPSDVLFEIVNLDKLFVEITLFDEDANRVSKGQELRFFINNETEQHKAKIYQTAKSIDSDKTYKVYASLEKRCKNVLPGMYVNAVIETSKHNVTAVPNDAVVNFDGKDYIFVFLRNKTENNKPFTEYRMVQVHKGVTEDGYTQLILPDGFNYKDKKVVVKGAYNLLSAKKNAGEMSC